METANRLYFKKARGRGRRDRGFVMVLALVMMIALTGALVVATSRTTGSAHHVSRDYHEERVFQVADGGVNSAERWLKDLLHTNSYPEQSQLDEFAPPTISGYDFLECSVTKEPFDSHMVIHDGPFAGMTAEVQPYRIVSRAENTVSSVQQAVEVQLHQYWVNLFQYAIYYDGDLEIFPSNPSVFVGRIHSNSNIYLGSESCYDIIGTVSAAGHIYNTPKDLMSVYHGKARIADRIGQWHDLSYDSRDPDWVTRSLGDWDGLVLDSAHGMMELPPPVLTMPDAIEVIKRASGMDDSTNHELKFCYRAGLKIIDGMAIDSLGNSVTLPAGIIDSSTVWDFREQRFMQMRNINIGALTASGQSPANHVLYVSYSHPNAAVRFINGSTLPAGGLTIATDNPCYVKGDYNIVNKQPAAFFCDAFNLYSNNWLDSKAAMNLNFRNATNTWLNACIVTGDKPTTNGHYSGGAGNLIRLHERWSASCQLTYRGSMVCIWNSEQAVGDFKNASFWEHHRNSSWDQTLNDPAFWPDHKLLLQKVTRAAWRPVS